MSENTLPPFSAENGQIPLLPLRDVVLYPHMVIPLFVGRSRSIKALDIASDLEKQIFLVAQKSPNEDEPNFSDLYEVGTLANILQKLKLPDGTVKVLVEGDYRARIDHLSSEEGFFTAQVSALDVDALSSSESDVYKRTALEQFDRFIQINKKIPTEVLT